MTWERGKQEVDRLLDDGELEQVTPSDEVAVRLLDDAEAHLRLAAKGIEDDPAGALQLSYDAARKAAAALLAVQGLRATSRGGHIAVLDAIRAQFDDDDRGQLDTFGKVNRLRRRRNDTEYPDSDSPTITEGDAEQALATARDAVDAARRIIDTGQLDPFM